MRKLTLIVTLAFVVVVGLTVATMALAQEAEPAPEPLDYFVLVFTDAYELGTLPDWVVNLLAQIFVEDFIAPETGEAPDQIRQRLTKTGTGYWRGLVITSEDRCSPYSSGDYVYPQAVEAEIVESMGGHIYGPYTGTYFESTSETDIEHIVARSEAHDSGLCAANSQVRSSFSADLLNLTLASPSVNRHQKRANDAAEWLPSLNQCWFADRVIRVRVKYGLTIDQSEADILDSVLSNCQSVEMELLSQEVAPTTTPAATATPLPIATPVPTPTPRPTYASCAEAEAAGEQRIQGSNGPGRGFPAWMVPSARDGDGDGVVCEK